MSNNDIISTITNLGLQAISDSMTGQDVIFTKMVTGDGSLTSQNPETLTSLVHPVSNLIIEHYETNTDTNGVYLKVTSFIREVRNAYYFRELGLYARFKDSDKEFLYAYVNKGDMATYIPKGNNFVTEEVATMIVPIGRADNITVMCDTESALIGLQNKADIDFNNINYDAKVKINQLKALRTGDANTDKDVLNAVINYAHSTFDLSKFTVAGTPTITDDGIASGFVSQTNFLNATYTSTTPTTSVDIWTKVIITEVTETSGVYWAIDGNLRLMRSSATAIGLRGFSGALSCDVTGLSLALNDEVIIHANVTGTNATVDVWINGVKSSNSVTHSNTIERAYSHLVVGGQYNNGNYSPLNSIDLKYQRVLFDGVEVFSGNKTGLDVIKPDDYTVVGTPTISADGIITFSDADNYVSGIAPSLWNGKSWRFDIDIDFVPYTTDESNANTAFIHFCGDRYSVIGYNPSWNSLSTRFYATDGESHLVTIENISSKFGKGKIHLQVHYDYSLGELYFFATQNGVTYKSSVQTYTNKDFRNQTANFMFANGYNYNSEFPIYTPIDLNSVKFYVDGNLVYQPCLKIPYTKSKTGSKIADVSVRPRVTDMYEQFGYAPYYTLSDTDFTLPMGELYGMLEKSKTTGFLGQTVFSLDPLFNDGLHLLDGALLQGDGVYKSFIDNYIKPLYNSTPSRFVTETVWQQSVSTHGVCGYYVYDSTNNTVRLPKVTGFVEGTLDSSALGSLVEAGLPLSWLDHTHTRGDMNITGNIVNNPVFQYADDNSNGAFRTTNLGLALIQGSSDGYQIKSISFDASRSWTGSTSAPNYATTAHNASTVQPQSIKGYMYIVVANNVSSVATLNQSSIITEVNSKADMSLSNVNNTAKVLMSGMGMPSARYIDLTFGVSGTRYTAPANGWFIFSKRGTEAGQWITADCGSTRQCYTASNNQAEATIYMAVKKGDVLTLNYILGGENTFSRFVYAQGSESEV